jgi:hypothetical protein
MNEEVRQVFVTSVFVAPEASLVLSELTVSIKVKMVRGDFYGKEV